MVKYEVLKQVKDKDTGESIKVGTIIERTIKEVTEFEKKYPGYLKRVEESK